VVDSVGMSGTSRKQRWGAYAVVLDPPGATPGRLLLTRMSPTGYPVGSWNLPGGGIDHGESPDDTVRRELFEETGLTAATSRLVDVHDIHVVDPTREGPYADFHGVHLLYAVGVVATGPLRIVDVGGTTDRVEWVELDRVRSLPVLSVVEHVLDHLDQFGSETNSAR